MKIYKKILLLILSFFIISNICAEDIDDEKLKRVILAFKYNMENDIRLDPIRGYIQMQFDETELKPESLLDRKPTAAETIAIDAYIENVHEYFRGLSDQPYKIEEKVNGDDWVSILYRLKSGGITYLDHKRFTEKWREAMLNPKILELSCIVNNPNDYVGMEIIVKVNFTTNTIWSSKGDNKSNFIINENYFQYNVNGNSVFNISRNSGNFTVINPEFDGILVGGTCSEVKKKRF